VGPLRFSFEWSGTNFNYSDSNRTFISIMLKPYGSGPFPAVIINHGAGGSVTNYSLQKAREMSPWGLVAIAPSLTSATRLTGSSKPATTRPLIPKTWKNSFQNGQSFSDWNGLRQALPYGSIPGGRALPAPMQLLGRKGAGAVEEQFPRLARRSLRQFREGGFIVGGRIGLAISGAAEVMEDRIVNFHPASLREAEGHFWGYTQRFFRKVIHNCPCQTGGKSGRQSAGQS
jgi:hypothetical protein